MARTGKKIMYISTTDPDEIDDITRFLKVKNKGLRYNISFSHNSGLELTFYGPDDKIKLLEYELQQFLSSREEE